MGAKANWDQSGLKGKGKWENLNRFSILVRVTKKPLFWFQSYAESFIFLSLFALGKKKSTQSNFFHSSFYKNAGSVAKVLQKQFKNN